jgi:hypothetical protein
MSNEIDSRNVVGRSKRCPGPTQGGQIGSIKTICFSKRLFTLKKGGKSNKKRLIKVGKR